MSDKDMRCRHCHESVEELGERVDERCPDEPDNNSHSFRGCLEEELLELANIPEVGFIPILKGEERKLHFENVHLGVFDEERRKRFFKAVHIIGMYIASSEGIDRSYPHAPEHRTISGFEVVVARHSRWREHNAKIRELNELKNHLIKELDLSRDDQRAAVRAARKMAERAIDECRCRGCLRAGR